MSNKNKHYCIVFVFSLLYVGQIHAQTNSQQSVDQFISDIFEQFTAETEKSIDYDAFYEDLKECARNPVNINHTTREELKHLVFLTDIQIENILEYVYENGAFVNLYELQLVRGLDMTDIRRMLPFIKLGEGVDQKNQVYWHDLYRYAENELTFRTDKTIEKKAGYSGADPLYSGDSWYEQLRYSYRFRNMVQAGFTAEKDAGEAYWNKKIKGFDFYTAYIRLNKIFKNNTLILGDYKVSFGQGLVINTAGMSGKSGFVQNISSRSTGISGYSSTNEASFLRGLGLTVNGKNHVISLFISTKMCDADTTDTIIRSISSTGYHRTQSELMTKNNVRESVFGANVMYTGLNYQLGITTLFDCFNKAIEPIGKTYNYYYFKGKNQFVTGISYRARLNKLNVFGETAFLTTTGGLATINGGSFSPASYINLVVLQRYYTASYHVIHASSFGENTIPSNESGIYMGAELRPFAKWKFACYLDSYRFAWLKFGVDAPSWGRDYLLQADYNFKRNVSMYLRLRYKENEKNKTLVSQTMPELYTDNKFSLRYQLTTNVNDLVFKSVVDGNICPNNGQHPGYGLLFSEEIAYHPTNLPWQIDFRYMMFDAADYSNRIYSYEKDILHVFSIPVYSGKGSRMSLVLRYDVNKRLSMWLKVSQTVYSDSRTQIGSGGEAIQGNRKSDIRYEIKWDL